MLRSALSCASRVRCGRRLMCTSASGAPPPHPSPSAGACFGAGVAGGGIGGLVGLGGGVIMVPIMTGFGRMTQHQAVGTSSAAVAGTGLSSAISFGSAGAVDFLSAGILAAGAMLTARAGASYTARFNPLQLQRVFSIFQICVGPLVPMKAYITRNAKAASAETSTGEPPRLQWTMSSPIGERAAKRLEERAPELLAMVATGCVAGFASGMFGIGGGVILTPALCLITDMPYACVLGTTLASMVPPALVSATTHHGLGNVVTSAVLPLVGGAAVGAFGAGQVAVRVPEEPLQWAFAFFITGTGLRKYVSLIGKL